MKRQVFFILFSFLLYLPLQAQQIKKAEYFIDTDPGPSLGIPIPLSDLADSIDIKNVELSTDGLAEGIHTLHIRILNSNGLWGAYQSSIFRVMKQVSGTVDRLEAGKIVQAEYFIDTDPGPGLGTAIPIASSSDSINIKDIEFSTNAMAEGMHTLQVRILSENGLWSAYQSTIFRVMKASSTVDRREVGKIVQAEYFIDTDPGPGFGMVISIAAPADSINIKDIEFSTDAMTEGMHTLHVRILSENGIWGAYQSTIFRVMKQAGPNSDESDFGKIVQAEFFTDNDPGVGKGKDIPIGLPTDSLDIKGIEFATDTMSEGTHALYVRVKSEYGFWASYSSTTFRIMKQRVDNASIRPLVYGEYFVGDTDPGFGKGVIIDNVPANDTLWNFDIEIETASLVLGNHLVTTRFMRSDGTWTFPQTFNFDVCLDPPSVPSGIASTICGGGGTTTIKAVGDASDKFVWYDASFGGAPITSSNSAEYTTPVLTESKNYYVAKSGTTCNSSRAKVPVTVVKELFAPEVSSYARCGAGPLLLTAAGAAPGNLYRWYDTDTSKVWLQEGGPEFLTDSIHKSRSYYVALASSDGKCESAKKGLAVIVKTCQNQEINFPPIGDLVFGIDDYIILNATSSSGLPVTYEVAVGPVTLSGDTLFLKGIGEVAIRAKQMGNLSYNSAPPKLRIFRIFASSTSLVVDYNAPACTGEPLQLTATAVLNGKYFWTGPNGFKSSERNPLISHISFADSGKYALTVYSPGDTLSAFIQIPVFRSPDKISLEVFERSKCDKEYDLIAQGDSIVSYQWYFNAKGMIGFVEDNYSPNSTGVYSVKGSNKYGCYTSSAPVYVNVDSDSLPEISKVKNSDKLSCTPAESYQWYVNNYYIAGTNSREIPLVFNGSYTVRAVDKNGCEKYSLAYSVNDDALVTFSRMYVNNSGVVSLNAMSVNAIITAPQPSDDETVIHWSSPTRGQVRLNISNSLGMLMEDVLVDKNSEELSLNINTSSWNPGMYTVSITSKDKTSVGRILVIH